MFSRIRVIKSNDALEVLEPLNIKALLPVKAIVGHGLHDLVGDAELLLDEPVDGLEQLLREGFDFRSGIVVGVEDVKSMGLSIDVAVGEVDVGDFEALSHDGVDAHGLLTAGLSDADGHLVHLALEVFLLLLLLLLLLALLLVELSGSLDVGEKPHLVSANGFGQLNESVVAGDGPSALVELLLIGGEVIKVF